MEECYLNGLSVFIAKLSREPLCEFR